MLKLLTAAALAVSSLSTAAVAQAEPADATISYRDLDLRDASAVRTLDRRLDRAIAAACGEDTTVRELSRIRAVHSCKVAKRAEISVPRSAAIAAAARSASAVAVAR